MVQTTHKTGPWNLSELKDIPKNGYNVFSCFHCGGGSTMGYKLSGFNVLGGVEIDPEMMAVYKENHKPALSYLMGVQDFNKIDPQTLPKPLRELDILDGSPPCSSFSMAGSREKAWGKNKKFREGQAVQVLDDLFFHFIETARLLQPKVVVAENVKGLIMGKAKGYVKEIAQLFNHAGYELQLFLLNAAFMGVPQKRERTFFIARRKDLKLPKLDLKFNEKPILFKDIMSGEGKQLPKSLKEDWHRLKKNKQKKYISSAIPKDIFPTLVAKNGKGACVYRPDKPMFISQNDARRVQTFPEDYNFDKFDAHYICGMSVPPYMMNRVSKQIELQWLNKLNKG